MASKVAAERKMGYIIYIDTGGTFSDCYILSPDGTFVTGKAQTTPTDLSIGFLGAIEVAAGRMGMKLDQVLSNTTVLGYGTTEGTNIVVTGTGASKLGMITTLGNEDRTIIGRLRAAGLTRKEGMHIARADKAKPLIPRTRIKGVPERLDMDGKVVIPLDEREVRRAVRELIDDGVEGIAVCFLWSFLNPDHERRVREIIKEMAPNVSVSLSSDVAPLVREYPRFMTAVIDIYIGRALRELLDRIGAKVRGHGYKRPFLILQATGGVARSEIIRPVTTLHSGPVGGFAGVDFLKERFGYDNAVGSDVGGTSFDVCVSPKGAVEYLREPIVGRFEISNPMREITTIGAGGGTIARVEKVARLLIVGPESAGSDPGPVCYGKTGKIPTITDADVVMNRIDPDYFLGGRIKLDRQKALKAIKEQIAEPLGMDIMKAAEGIVNVLDANMGSTLRTALAVRGVASSEYALFVYGGAGPTHCAGYSSGLPFKEIIIPPYAPVFCAFGAATADIKHRYESSPFVSIRNIPYDKSSLRFKLQEIRSLDDLQIAGLDRFNRIFDELETKAKEDMKAEGIPAKDVVYNYEVLGRYGGQLWELRARVPIRRIASVKDLAVIIKAFEDRYFQEYGLQAMAPRGGLQFVTVAAELVAHTPKPVFKELPEAGRDPAKALKGKRGVYLNGDWRQTKIYEWSRLGRGNVVRGPAIVESLDTSVVVPSNRVVLMDKYGNLLMRNQS